MSANGGFSLLEVLIATMLLAFGMLALSALQLRSIVLASEIDERNRIASLAAELAEAMHANPLPTVDSEGNRRNGWQHYESTLISALPPLGICRPQQASQAPSSCDVEAQVANDLFRFRTELATALPRSSKFAAGICRSTGPAESLQLDDLHCAASGPLAIKVVWQIRNLDFQAEAAGNTAKSVPKLATFQLRVAP